MTLHTFFTNDIMFMLNVFLTRGDKDETLCVIGGKMKIIEAIRKIPHERIHQGTSKDKQIKLVHVQTVLPQEDLLALKKKNMRAN